MEKYNKYHESLDIDCGYNKPKEITKNNDCCCGGINLPSHDNEIEILIRQLKREVKELLKTTEARLLCQDKKIAETMVYIKNNLSNALRDLLNSMLESGQLEDLITGVVENAIELLEYDVNILKNDMTQAKANISSLQSDVINLKSNKTGFSEYEETSIDSTFQNVEISHEYYDNSIIYITKIKNIEKLSCLPTNGDPTININTNRTNVIDYSKTNDNYKIYVNAGMSGINIFDGVVNETTRLDCTGYFGFTSDNQMKFYDGINNTITSQQLVNDGIVNCIPAFVPIIENGNLYDFNTIASQSSTNEIARKFSESLSVKNPRQLIANDTEGNYYIYSIFGRTTNNEGLDYYQMQDYFRDKGFLNVFNLDGGGSTQTVINKENLIAPSQDFALGYRIVPSVIGFKLKEVN